MTRLIVSVKLLVKYVLTNAETSKMAYTVYYVWNDY